jgi:CheY-like chemotaxis protein
MLTLLVIVRMPPPAPARLGKDSGRPDRYDLVITDQTMPHMTGFN